MHKKIKYINHRNEAVEFGSKYLFINDMDLWDYAWNFDTDFNRIGNFRREIQQRALTISIYGSTTEEANNNKNNIFEIFEKDVLANTPGKLWVGDYYLNCYIVEGSISKYYRKGNYLAKETTIVTDAPIWIKETKYDFIAEDEINTHSSYPYGYPYGYSNNLGIRNIINENFVGSDIVINIYGPVINPTIFIRTHPYIVNTTILAGEYLTISTKDKTIIKTKNNGEQVNEFHRRNKEYSVFQKIKPGSNIVSWDETFNFSIIVIEERSEPKWI